MNTRVRKHLKTVQGERGLQAARLLEAEGPAATEAPGRASAIPPAGSLPLGPGLRAAPWGAPWRGEAWSCRAGGSVAAEASAGCPPGGRSKLLARLPTARQYHLQGWMTPRAAATPTRGEAPGSEERQRGQGPGMAGEWLGECGPCPPCGPSGGRLRQGRGTG